MKRGCREQSNVRISPISAVVFGRLDLDCRRSSRRGGSRGTGLSEVGGGISLPGNVRGIEVYGVAAHRLFYTIGVINGIGPGLTGETADGNSRKDYYARIDYKFGGMGLDDSESSAEADEMAGMAGMLDYTGDGSKIDFAIMDAAGNLFKMQDRRRRLVRPGRLCHRADAPGICSLRKPACRLVERKKRLSARDSNADAWRDAFWSRFFSWSPSSHLIVEFDILKV